MFGDLDAAKRRQALMIVIVAALGYFVDIFDLLLFGMVRIKSLVDLGFVPGTPEMLEAGGALLSRQMEGMLVGGILWGILGDKRGRLSVLFGSIILYSVANIANSFVQTVGQYELWRFIAGVGLAGELGAGITLVAEVLPKKTRGIGTSIVAGVGILGAVVGYEVNKHFDWRTCYQIGGALGLGLLVLRLGVTESGLFLHLSQKTATARGDFRLLFNDFGRFRKYLAVIALGLPLWYMVGILVTFSPEFMAARAAPFTADPARAIALCYLGLAIGDVLSGFVSQSFQSRKKAVLLYMTLQVLAIGFYFAAGARSAAFFDVACFLMGLAGGYWALFVTIGAEQFGTDIRATVTTTVPNFVRGALSLMISGFLFFKGHAWSVPSAGMTVGAVVFLLSFWGLSQVEETYHKDLDYTESPATGSGQALRRAPKRAAKKRALSRSKGRLSARK